MGKTTFFRMLGILSIFVTCLPGAGQEAVDDLFIRRHLPQYPQAVVFKLEYLDFFAEEHPAEKEMTAAGEGRYVLRGDFNRNGKAEIALAGLASLKPMKGAYVGFVLILERENDGYRRVFFDEYLKEVRPPQKGEPIRNLMLIERGDRLLIGFAAATDFAAVLKWDGNKYVYETDFLRALSDFR